VDPLIEQITKETSGLILVAGMDARQYQDQVHIISSGRTGFFRILARQILEQHPNISATVVAGSRDVFRVTRSARRRVDMQRVHSTIRYSDLIPVVAKRHRLLVVDHLIPDNAAVIFEAANNGALLITQMDTNFRGYDVGRSLQEWGVPLSHINSLRWVITVQRIPILCHCKRTGRPDAMLVDAIQRRHPNLKINLEIEYAIPGACDDCENTGRHSEITAFDFYKANPDRTFGDPSLLPLAEYMLGLAEQSLLPLNDLLYIDSDQQMRTYKLLVAAESALAGSKAALERQAIELETANQVLKNRTAELVSLQEIGQALIGSNTLRDLARQVCRQASQLCGADRAIFYFLKNGKDADVLATHGWAPGRVPLRVTAQEACDPDAGPTPSVYNHWPPGVKARHPDVEGATLKAGLRIPLIAQGQPVGAMIVHNTTHPHFHPGAVALMQTFANQAAIAIQRAGLIENLQQKISQLEAAQAGLAQKERMDRELELARQVQQAVLPQTFPEISGYRFAAQNRPARQVGGDFYDVIDLGNGNFGLVVADVSDKGIPAAVYMALTRSLMLAEARREVSPVAVLRNVNELLRELGRARMFVTVFYGIVDGKSRMLTYARAGHDRPILVRDGDVHELIGDGVLLGYLGSEHLHLTEESLALEVGDRLILYTDGLTDTVSPDGLRFDRTGFHSLLQQMGHLPVGKLCQVIFESLIAYQDSAEQFDDMTLLVMQVDPNMTNNFSKISSNGCGQAKTGQVI
jgi:sigma-B regulation protein RsbU (phosphoserine phosphatase)